jgi:hypothetical protein
VALLASLAPACSPTTDGTPTEWPDGTALIVNDEPILADHINRLASWISSVDPTATPLHLQRLALTNLVFPCRAARTLSGERWRAALDEAHLKQAELVATDGAAPDPGETVKGSWQELGLASFGAALEAGPGRWSSVIEAPGVFRTVRLDHTSEDGLVLTVRRVDFRYLDEAELKELEPALDASRLRIVDETWREAVPLAWIHRLKEGSS